MMTDQACSFGWMAQQIIDPHRGRPAPTEQAEMVTRMAREHGGITYAKMGKILGLSRSTCERYTKDAQRAGLVRVRMTGPRRNTAWIEAI